METNVVKMSHNQLSKIPSYNRNRLVDSRVPKLTKILKKGFLPPQAEMAVGVATKAFSVYKKGDKFLLNGNTRREVYKKEPDLIPTGGFNVTLYNCDNEEYAHNLYLSFDSSDSVETPNDKVTGYIRMRNYIPISETIKKGKFKIAIEIASSYGHDSEGVYLNSSPFDYRLDYFWNELIYLDQTNLNLLKLNKRYSAAMLSALLLITKKYGTKNKRLQLLINNLQEGITTTNDGSGIDGVHYVFYNLYIENKKTWTATNRTVGKPVCSQILFCFDKFMNDEILTKSDIRKLKNNKVYEYYRNYIDGKK